VCVDVCVFGCRFVGLGLMPGSLARACRFGKHWQPYVKSGVPIERMLKFRYLLSVEGNDVATGACVVCVLIRTTW
jgi:hypothetical protein